MSGTKQLLSLVLSLSLFAVPVKSFAQASQVPQPKPDPYAAQQWYLNACNIPEALKLALESRRMRPIEIAVLDTGCTPTEDIKASIDNSDPEISRSGSLSDAAAQGGHGTMLVSVCAAAQNNGLNTAGVNPYVKILPIRLVGGASPTEFAIRDAIYYVMCKHPDVRILVLGCSPTAGGDNYDNYKRLKSIFSVFTAGGRGLIFAPAGNNAKRVSGNMDPHFILVAASDEANKPAAFSNFGPPVWFLAPGQNIYCSNSKGDITNSSGTAFSAAIVGSIASLVWSIRQDLRAAHILQILQRSGSLARQRDRSYGYGIIDAELACKIALGLVR